MNRIVILAIISFIASLNKIWSQEQAMMMNPVSEAKIYFADKPFTVNHDGSKTDFNSSGFIYGRLDLEKQTVQRAFSMTTEEHHHYYLRCWVLVFKNGEEIGQHQGWDYIYIKKGDQHKTTMNFDILPEPGKATTVMSSDGYFKGGKAAGPLYQQISPELFRENGEYIIKVRFYLESYNAWGNVNPVSQWPMVQGEFKFQFDGKDVPAILKNYEKANEVIAKKLNQ